MARNRYHSGALLVKRALAALRGLGMKAPKFRRSGAWLLFFAALCGLGYAARHAVLRSPYFLVRNVEVEPTPHLSRTRVVELLGLDRPTNVFSFDETAGTEALLAEPWVAAARVRKALPDRVMVQVQERTAAGAVVLDTLYLVDDTGRPFVRPLPRENAGLPLVTGVERETWDRDPETVAGNVRAALSLARRYGRLELSRLRPLSDVRVAPGGRLELMVGTTRVALGQHDHPAKLKRLQEVFKTLEKRGMDAAYVLLSDDLKRAVVKERPGSPQAAWRLGQRGEGVD